MITYPEFWKEINRMNARLSSITDEIKSDVRTLESKMQDPEDHAWKPEDLIGKLVRVWFDGDPELYYDGIYVGYIKESHEIVNQKFRRMCCDHVRPLTEAEALAFVWRAKPKTRYDWSNPNVPKWAKWIIMSTPFSIWALENAPSDISLSGFCTDGKVKSIEYSVLIHDTGGDSLERRPQ